MTRNSLWAAVGGLLCIAALIAFGARAMAQPAPADLRWVRSAAGYVAPPSAVVGGSEEGAALVVCRGPYRAGVYPGKLVKGNCNAAVDGKEVLLHDYEVLTGSGVRWGPPQANYAGAFVAGGESGRPLFLCQAPYKGGVHPGKIVDNRCAIGYGGEEVPVREFAVLYAGIMEAPGSYAAAAAPTPVYGSPPPGYSPPTIIIPQVLPQGRPTSCSAAGNPVCPGCSISCPAGKQASCSQGEVHETSGFSPVCWTRAKCECG